MSSRYVVRAHEGQDKREILVFLLPPPFTLSLKAAL